MVNERDMEKIERLVHRWEISADVIMNGDDIVIQVYAADPSQLGGMLDDLLDRYIADVQAEGIEGGVGTGTADGLRLTVRQEKGLFNTGHTPPS